MIQGGVECGPNAVFAFGREAYRKTDFHLRDTLETLAWPGFRIVARKYWRTGLGEFRRSLSKSAFVHALQLLIPEITASDREPGGAGIRTQTCDRHGRLLDEFPSRTSRNDNHICITQGLKAGQVIALRDPTRDLEHQEAGSKAPGADKNTKKSAPPIPGASE